MIGAKTVGVAHPVLPCGVKIYVEYKGKQVLTQVIDRGHTVPGREFDLTQALAKLLAHAGHADDSVAFRALSPLAEVYAASARPCARARASM